MRHQHRDVLDLRHGLRGGQACGGILDGLDHDVDRTRIAELPQRLDAALADTHIAIGLGFAQQGLDGPEVSDEAEGLGRRLAHHPEIVVQRLQEIRDRRPTERDQIHRDTDPCFFQGDHILVVAQAVQRRDDLFPEIRDALQRPGRDVAEIGIDHRLDPGVGAPGISELIQGFSGHQPCGWILALEHRNQRPQRARVLQPDQDRGNDIAVRRIFEQPDQRRQGRFVGHIPEGLRRRLPDRRLGVRQQRDKRHPGGPVPDPSQHVGDLSAKAGVFIRQRRDQGRDGLGAALEELRGGIHPLPVFLVDEVLDQIL